MRQLLHWFYKTKMPLTVCPDCEAQISTVAPTCPRCGRPLAAAPAKETLLTPAASQGTRLLMLAGLAVLLCVVVVLCALAAFSLLRASIF